MNQIKKEMLITLGVFLSFFMWWYFCGYYIDPSIFLYGMPAWFFFSCIIGSILLNFIICVVVKKFFKSIDFDDDKF